MLLLWALPAVLMALLAPTISQALYGWQRDTATSLLVAHLHLASNIAATARQPVGVCASGDGLTCSGQNNWQHGWIVYLQDAAALAPHQPAAPPLAQREALWGLRRLQTTANVAGVLFAPTAGLQPAQTVTFIVEPQGGPSTPPAKVTVVPSGRIQVHRRPPGP